MEGAGWAALRIHVCIVGWLGRCYPDRNLGLHAIRPINWAKALGLSLFGRRRLSNEWRNVCYLFRSMPTDNLVYLYIQWGVRMSNLAARTLFCATFIVFSFSANAFDLNGAWTADASNCDKVFVKKSNRVSMTRNSGVFGGGFIVEGNQMRGQAKTCKITSRKEEGGACCI